MKLIVGLGNPGARYAGTYHNVGFDVADRFAARHGAPFGSAPAEAMVARVRGLADDVLVAKPLTFMNLSGGAVGALARYFRVDLGDLLIVADEVQLPTGRLRARRGGSAGGHNGLKSIIEALGTTEFPRLRVGVGRGDERRDLADHVLSRIPLDERAALEDAVERAVDACDVFVSDGIGAVMNRFNADPARQTAEADEASAGDSGKT
ncbi:MAG: aminoacyl-tRNA hydrolase [Vicinamibacterales bacterium]